VLAQAAASHLPLIVLPLPVIHCNNAMLSVCSTFYHAHMPGQEGSRGLGPTRELLAHNRGHLVNFLSLSLSKNFSPC
jgi:hypothetical protein